MMLGPIATAIYCLVGEQIGHGRSMRRLAALEAPQRLAGFRVRGSKCTVIGPVHNHAPSRAEHATKGTPHHRFGEAPTSPCLSERQMLALHAGWVWPDRR